MENVNINPEKGPHAGAEISDDELHYLSQVVLWELSLRMEKEQFASYLRRAIEVREQSADTVDEVRRERELMQFAAEVMMDLERLPTTEDAVTEPTTGMYL